MSEGALGGEDERPPRTSRVVLCDVPRLRGGNGSLGAARVFEGRLLLGKANGRPCLPPCLSAADGWRGREAARTARVPVTLRRRRPRRHPRRRLARPRLQPRFLSTMPSAAAQKTNDAHRLGHAPHHLLTVHLAAPSAVGSAHQASRATSRRRGCRRWSRARRLERGPAVGGGGGDARRTGRPRSASIVDSASGAAACGSLADERP